MQIETLALADQVRMAAQKQNRIAALIGSWLAFLAPLGSFALAHFADLRGSAAALFNLLLLAACLAFSAPKVFKWARSTFGSVVEAVGFVVLTEGLSMAPHGVHWLLTLVSFYSLIVLLVVNSVTGAVRVSLSQRELRAAARAQAVETLTVKVPAASNVKKTARPATKKKAPAKKKQKAPAEPTLFSAA